MVFKLILKFAYKSYTYILDDNNATIRDLCRYIRDNMNVSIGSFTLYKQSRYLNYVDNFTKNIIDIYKNDDIITVNLKLLGGICGKGSEKLKICINLPNYPYQNVDIICNPDDQISKISQNIIEILDKKEKINLMFYDVELVHDNNILYDDNQIAMYPKLSRSYIRFIYREEFGKNILSKLWESTKKYYGYEVIGEEIENIPTIEMRLRTKEQEKIKHICPICIRYTYNTCAIILPKCRHIFCKECLDKYVKNDNDNCPICREKI